MPKRSTPKAQRAAKRPLEGNRLRPPAAKRKRDVEARAKRAVDREEANERAMERMLDEGAKDTQARADERQRRHDVRQPTLPHVIDVDPDASVDESEEGDERAYPLFPKIIAGGIHKVTVLRYPPTVTNGGRVPVPIAHPWDPWTCDRDRVGEVCGGGEFMVQARDRFGRVIAAVKFTLEGAAKIPGVDDAKREGGLSVHETPEGGWTTIPGLAPEVNAIIVHSQQMSHQASLQEQKAIAGMAATLQSFAQAIPEMMRAVTESARVPLARIEHLSARLTAVEAENVRLSSENVKLQIAKVKKDSEKDDDFWKGIFEESKPLLYGAANKMGLLPDNNGGGNATQKAEVHVTGTTPPEKGTPAASGAGSGT